MNLIEIGKFIAECRREVNMTQVQLADRLGITNRAVSKWETGKSLPDASIMLELCDELNISVSELLSGRKLDNEEEKTMAENNMMNMILAKEQIGNLQIATEVLIVAGIIITITLTSILAKTNIEKITTILSGGFVWIYGMWMRVKLRKSLKSLDEN